MYDWGDLKYFLAVAKAGSTLAAARALNVNQTTVARRIAALESDLKLKLFDRHQDGYRLSEGGELMLAQAERVATEAETLHRLVAQRGRHLGGTIRLTTAEPIANVVITPLLSEFMDLYPDIRVEVIATDRRLDLIRGEADIAVRAGYMPKEPSLIVRKLADGLWSLYCSRTYAQKRGMPSAENELNDHLVIGAEGDLAKLDPFIWLAQAAPKATIRSVCSSVANMVVAIKASHGVGPLPCSVAAVEPELVECFHLSQFKYQYFLVMPETLKDLPRIRAFSDFLNCRSAELKKALEGRPPKT